MAYNFVPYLRHTIFSVRIYFFFFYSWTVLIKIIHLKVISSLLFSTENVQFWMQFLPPLNEYQNARIKIVFTLLEYCKKKLFWLRL